ncbi:unnamed protein product [Arabidopsis halleri]
MIRFKNVVCFHVFYPFLPWDHDMVILCCVTETFIVK